MSSDPTFLAVKKLKHKMEANIVTNSINTLKWFISKENLLKYFNKII